MPFGAMTLLLKREGIDAKRDYKKDRDKSVGPRNNMEVILLVAIKVLHLAVHVWLGNSDGNCDWFDGVENLHIRSQKSSGLLYPKRYCLYTSAEQKRKPRLGDGAFKNLSDNLLANL
jgi:hypothetical protein